MFKSLRAKLNQVYEKASHFHDITELYVRTEHLIDITAAMVNYIGEMPIACDKCSEFEDQDMTMCFKCDNTGVILHRQLFNWPHL